MRFARPPKDLILDMILSAEQALVDIGELDEAAFILSDHPLRLCRGEVTLLTEAAYQLPEEFRELHPEIDWPALIATRHKFVHGYHSLNASFLYAIVRRDLPALLVILHSLYDSLLEQDQ